jgi:hypothetical protein
MLISTPKAIEKELESDGRLFFQLSLANELKMTLSELKEKVTDEEMVLWQCFYSIRNRQQEKEMEKIKQRSRRR